MNPVAEKEIAKLLESGDLSGAFTIAVRAYGSIIRNHVGGIVRDQDRADDAYSTFLYDLWAGLGDFRGESSLFHWARRIATNAANRQHRDPWISRGERLDDTDRLQAPLPRWTTARYRLTAEKLRLRLARANLSVQDELVVVLHVDWRFDFNAIEELIGIPAGTARMRYKRAKDKLKKVLLAKENREQG